MYQRFSLRKELAFVCVILLAVASLIPAVGASAPTRNRVERSRPIAKSDKLTAQQEQEKREKRRRAFARSANQLRQAGLPFDPYELTEPWLDKTDDYLRQK